MPDSELDRFVSQVDGLASTIMSHTGGTEANNLMLQVISAISNAGQAGEDDTARRKIDDLAIELQPKVVSIEWTTVFTDIVDAEYTASSVRLLLSMLWTVGGPRAISAFFNARPTKSTTTLSLVNAFRQLEPSELGTQYHLPMVIDQLESPINYEPVAKFVLEAMKVEHELTLDRASAAIVLAHCGKFPPSDLDGLRSVLQDSAKTIVLRDPSYYRLISKYVSLYPLLAYDVFASIDDRDAVAKLVAEDDHTDMLSAWCQQKEFTYALDILIRADTFSPSPIWASFLASTFGSDSQAFGALLDYMEAATGPSKSLRIVGAVAMLSQTVEPPKDKPERVQQIQALQLQLLHDNPRLINYGQGHDDAILANCELPAFTEDIEAEMKLCFQMMYEQQHNIQEVIAMLERFKHSDQPRDQDLFACMIHSLFEEYRFFLQYPVKALATTAVLFGSLVHFRLIEGIPLAIALKFILDALRQPIDSNMFRFGLQALVELRQRLPEFPKYCKVLLGIPGLQSQQQFFHQIQSLVDPTSESEGLDLFRSINVVAEEDEGQANETAVNKVSLAVNNLTAKTLAVKATEIVNQLPSVGIVKFANLVVSRAANEPNYQELYSNLLEQVPVEVSSQCINVVLRRVEKLLNSPDALSTESRTQLKNLGQFYGMLTLAKGKSVLFHQLNLKLLLAEAARYEKLAAVLPFVAKILAQAANSDVFNTVSPWISGLLATLSELYRFGSLNLTLKFEIEVLGKALSVDIPKTEPSMYIRDEVKQQEDAAAINASHGGPATVTSLATTASAPINQQMPRVSAPQGMPGNVPIGVPGISPLTQLPGQISSVAANIPAGTPAVAPNGMPPGNTSAAPPGVPIVGSTEFVGHPALRQLLDLARSKTLQDVLLPVIDRSVNIATYTTSGLIMKDFAREPDETKLQIAAHTQTHVLASSMAVVTARDQFVEAMAHNLRAIMIAQGYGDAQLLMEQVAVASRETMESLIPLIESEAREKAILMVDKVLEPLYEARQQARLSGRPFDPEDVPAPPIKLPEALSVRPGGLSDEQMAVYEQFSQQPAANLDAIGSYAISAQGLQAELHQLAEDIKRLEKLTVDSSKRLGDLNKDDEVLTLLGQLLTTARNGAKHTEEGPLRGSHLVVQALFGPASTNSILFRESLCYVLGELCRMSGITAKEVVLWLLYADDPKKFNANVIGTLLRNRLVTPAEIDASLKNDLVVAKPEVVNFASRLLLDALLGPEPYCLRSDFAGTIMALSQLEASEFPAAGILIQALEDTHGQGTGNEGHVFAEWTRLMQHHATAHSPVLLHAFVRDLQKLGWSPEQLALFVRTAVVVSIRSYMQSKSFVGVDAVAVLISTLLTTTSENEQFARAILTVVVLLIAKDHEGDSFDSLPYFRLLSSIACSLPRHYVNVFAETLVVLQPLAFPAFATSWITLASHRFVMGRLLESRVGWPAFFELLSTMLMFLRQVWLSSETESAVRGFTYQGVERICLVALHDAPEFFLRYANEITSLLVSEFVQLRNLVLCAFPSNTTLPEPVLTDSLVFSGVGSDITEAVDSARELLEGHNVLKLVENSVTMRSQLTPQVVSAIQVALTYAKPQVDRGIDYDSVVVSLLGYNSLATYVAYLAGENKPASGKLGDSGAAQLCARMLLTMPRDQRYTFISAMANQLRYPEKHTEFYSQLLLLLFTPYGEKMFKDAANDVRHVITRVLMERVMARRPHPWGLMMTVSQLLRSPEYHFWDMPFIKSSSEISNLFSTLYPHITQVEVDSSA